MIKNKNPIGIRCVEDTIIKHNQLWCLQKEKNHRFVYPLGKARIPHLLRCQGLAVADYSFALDALDL
jgi:hypothetical protein